MKSLTKMRKTELMDEIVRLRALCQEQHSQLEALRTQYLKAQELELAGAQQVSTLKEFCAWYCEQTGSRSVPGDTVRRWKKGAALCELV